MKTPRTSRAGRPRLGDIFLVTVAADYVYALRAGMRPVMHIVKAYGTSRKRAGGWVRLARQRRFLIGLKGVGGAAGGNLSAQARRLLGPRIEALAAALK